MPTTSLLLLALAVGSSSADEPATKYRIVSPKKTGIIATGINGRGDVVGFEWVEEKERPGVIGQAPFFAKGKEQTNLPLLKGYTATFPAAVSDTGLVVGHAGKPGRPGARVHMRNQAFVWDEKSGIRGLGVLPDDAASLACDVSRDGNRVSGFSIGDNRVRACVWDRVGEEWKGTALPHDKGLGSQVVALSDDGRKVAAVDGSFPCLWSRGEDGQWTREVIGAADSIIPRAVNNAGTVVGLRHNTRDGETDAVVWTRDEGVQKLEMPAGFVRSEASAVNNDGVVVGMMDGPRGSAIGPGAFVAEKGKVRRLAEGGPTFAAANAINDQGQVAGVLEEGEEDEAKDDAKPKPKP